MLRQDSDVSQTLDRIRYHHMLRNRQSEVDLNLMPRRGMAYERGVMIVSNPYTEDAMKKYNSMEMLMPRTGEVVHISKLPQSLYTPGKLVVRVSKLPKSLYTPGKLVVHVSKLPHSLYTPGKLVVHVSKLPQSVHHW